MSRHLNVTSLSSLPLSLFSPSLSLLSLSLYLSLSLNVTSLSLSLPLSLTLSTSVSSLSLFISLFLSLSLYLSPFPVFALPPLPRSAVCSYFISFSLFFSLFLCLSFLSSLLPISLSFFFLPPPSLHPSSPSLPDLFLFLSPLFSPFSLSLSPPSP